MSSSEPNNAPTPLGLQPQDISRPSSVQNGSCAIRDAEPFTGQLSYPAVRVTVQVDDGFTCGQAQGSSIQVGTSPSTSPQTSPSPQ